MCDYLLEQWLSIIFPTSRDVLVRRLAEDKLNEAREEKADAIAEQTRKNSDVANSFYTL